MNPLIVLEKKYINKFNFGGAVLIAFLKEKGGTYQGSLKCLAKELGVMSITGVFNSGKKLENIGIINAERNKFKEYKYTLNEKVLNSITEGLEEEEITTNDIIKEEKKDELYIHHRKLPQKVQNLVDNIEEIRKEKI